MKIPISQGRSFIRSIVRQRSDTYLISRETDIINERGARDKGETETHYDDLWLYSPSTSRIHEEYGILMDGDMAAVGIPDDIDIREGDIIESTDTVSYYVDTVWTNANHRDEVLTFANLHLVTRNES